MGYVFNRFLGFLLLPLYTHYFSPDQFGVFSLIYAFWFFAAVFYLYGMETAFQKFFAEAKGLDEQKRIYGSTLILILITSLGLSVLLYFFSPLISHLLTGNTSYAYLIKVLAVLLVVDSVSRFPMIGLNALQKTKIYTAINISTVIVNIFFNVLFIVIFHWGIESIFYAFMISYAFQFIFSFTVSFKYFSFSINALQVKALTGFSISFLFYGLFLISLDLIDRYFLGYIKGDEKFVIYSACYRIGMAMNLVISGFRIAWIPFFLKLKEEKDNKEIFSKIFSYFTYGGVLLFLIISLFAREMVQIRIGGFTFLDQKYWSGMTIVPYILLAYFLFGLYTNLNIASYYENRIKYLIISTGIGCVSNIIFNIILIPFYSVIGAAVATLLSYLLMFLVLYNFSQKIYFIKYEWGKIIPIIITSVILLLANIYLADIIPGVQSNIYFVYFAKIISVIILIIVLLSVKSHKPQNQAFLKFF